MAYKHRLALMDSDQAMGTAVAQRHCLCGACKPYGRLYVNLSEDDELGTFIFRTTGFNSIRTLAARLSYFAAVSGDKLSCLPLQLTLRGKSTTQSYRTPIYFVDLTLRDGVTLKDAVSNAQAIDAELSEHGFDQAALEVAAKLGYVNSAFEIDNDEAFAVVEEFYPVETGDSGHHQDAHGHFNHSLTNDDVTSIEQGLRQSVTAVS